MPVCALVLDLRLAASSSLKDKRMVLRRVLEGARRRFQVAAAETAQHDLRQRSELSFAAVASSAKHLEEVLDEVERFVWAQPDVEVLMASRHWLELEVDERWRQ